MHILVTGSKGQLGCAFRHLFTAGASEVGVVPDALCNAEVDYIDRSDVDIASFEAVSSWFDEHKPYDVVINCAAMTNVDGCDADRKAAFAANAQGPYHLALACAQQGAALVHVSTDYVFSGTEERPRTEDDIPHPISGYGQSKFAGEALVRATCPQSYIVRTAWLYGYVGKNFVKTMLSLAQTHSHITVVADQLGNPTSAEDVAYAICQMLTCGKPGIYHCTNEGTCSWAEFAQAIMDEFGRSCTVEPISSEEYKKAHPATADRPHFSSLDKRALRQNCQHTMRSWQEALTSYAHNFRKFARDREEQHCENSS
ncbi:dTDP-4-dehydrorhamnose reductase [Atopobium deltae]|uniref:dTDP-4-dehydrorhamnose reductase n=1 Tax=Atopobium deltae TaxID=1393034 RepID=A0A133XXC0_9ACTN|nr:dTDP-4-dehydrorhamnose reductase [Atopobium deltae]KXB35554.1 dTDP-4-dehydrorhamnose reductase [Atopobium deltae]